MSSQRYISDTLKRKKQKIKKIKLYAIIFFIILFFAGIISLTRLSVFQITKIKVTGTVFVERQEIEAKVQTILNSNIAWLIPQKNIFIFPKKELEQHIKQNPAIVSVKIRKNLFNTLSIDIQEQEKEMIYCTSIERSECMYINKTGFIYAQVKDIIIPEQEILIYSEQGIKKIQDTILKEELYTNVMLFVKNTARQDIRIGEVYIKSDGVIDFITREKTRLITSQFDDFEKDFVNLIALFEKNVITKEQLSHIEYIDLRFGNKVYYKNRTN